jgi:hypothetical protein
MDPELAQRFDEISRHFTVINRQFEQLNGRFDSVDRRFERVDQQFEQVYERIEEGKRHSGILVEGLRHEVHLLAEGLMTHIDVRHAEDRAYVDQKFQVTDNLIRLSFQSTDQLRQRVENLENRDQN